MKTIEPVRLLKLALFADAAASAAIAGLQLVFPALLAERLALPAVLLTESGMFLVAYALMLVGLASMARVWTAAIQLVIVGNVGWALACLVLAFSPLLSVGGLGLAFLLLQAVAVLLFAWIERAGLQASMAASPARSHAVA